MWLAVAERVFVAITDRGRTLVPDTALYLTSLYGLSCIKGCPKRYRILVAPLLNQHETWTPEAEAAYQLLAKLTGREEEESSEPIPPAEWLGHIFQSVNSQYQRK